MACRGPAPKSTTLRLIEGPDRRGRSGRTLDRSREPVPVAELPTPPYEMSPGVAAEWDRVVELLAAMKLASASDAYMLAGYCEAAALHARASSELAGQELLVDGSRSTNN